MKKGLWLSYVKLLALVLVIIVCVAFGISCKRGTPSKNDETSIGAITLVSDGKSNVRIVYNEKDTRFAVDSAKSLKASLSELGGAEIPLDEASSGDGVEILIGNTGAEKSKAALEDLEPNSYSITVSENKIIVVSNNIYLYSEAIENLLGALSASDGVVTLAGDYSKKSDSYPVVALSSGDYTIIYESDNGTASAQASALKMALASAGISIEVSSDAKSASGKEILLGETNRALSSKTQTYYKSATFGFSDDGNLAVKGALVIGVDTIMDCIKEFVDAKSDINIPQFLLERRTAKGYGTAPKYVGKGTEKLMENHGTLNSYVVQQDGASEDDYLSYSKKLKDEGYELYYSTKAQESLFSTYTDGRNIVNLSYIQYESPFNAGETVKYVNIAVECTDNVSLPELEDNSKYICELQVSLLNAHNTWLIRLEDGRFIMVDSGLEEANGRNNADLIYNTLVAQNELQGKPVIAAWVITHPHTDHVDAYYQFTQKYKDKVDLQMVISNMPNESVESLDKFSKKIYNGVTSAYPNAKFVVAHAGQRFAFAGLELDVLWTHENLYDVVYGNTNLSSSVFGMTMPGGRLIITGDQQKQGCQILNAIYREELKCDVVQICHHGYTGGDEEMYNSMDARVGIWPINYEEASKNGAYGNTGANHLPVNNFDFHLIMSVNDEVMTLREGVTKADLKQFRRWE
ncbi:MAG: MBL fold metallo-hydrolase [Clostridia bacterium]|nr:MBL fold metallo-hydrolase [Clostridia bacterium]